jgi:hypothetical protein
LPLSFIDQGAAPQAFVLALELDRAQVVEIAALALAEIAEQA